MQVLGEDDGEGEGEDLRGRSRQVDRGAQGDGERGHGVGYAVLLGLAQGDRDRGRRGGRAQCRQVGRNHGDQSPERVAAANDSGDNELDAQDDDLEDEDHDDDAQKRLHHRPGRPGVGEVEEDAEDVQGQQRDDDPLDEAGDDGPELDEALAQHAPGHHGQADPKDEGQQQGGHDLDGRRHLHREVAAQSPLRLGDVGQRGSGEQPGEGGGAHHEGEEACEEGRGVGQGRGDPEPLAGPASQIGDGGGHQADDDERDGEAEELAEQVGEGREDVADGLGDDRAAADPDRAHDQCQDDRADDPGQDAVAEAVPQGRRSRGIA